MNRSCQLSEIVKVFFKLGCIAFGGPAAHIAMMEDEIVSKRKWMDHQHFLDLMGITNLIPGPNSTEMTMHCGHERGGKLGLILAGVCFIFPAVIITGLLAWLYKEYGQLPEVSPFIKGIKPAVLAIILGAIIKLGKKAIKNIELGILGALVIIICFLGVNEILALVICGIIGATYFYLKNKTKGNLNSIVPLVGMLFTKSSVTQIASSKIFLSFLKVGAVLYGSGYVLFAYLDAELVSKGLLTRQELIDAIAVGQFTPGPVLSTATFIGYQLNGLWGAVAATLGIFIPSFLFVMLLNPLIPKMRQSKLLGYFLDSVNIAAVAVMIVVLFNMGKDTLVNWQSMAIATFGMIAFFGLKKANSMWIVLGGGLLGYLLQLT